MMQAIQILHVFTFIEDFNKFVQIFLMLNFEHWGILLRE
jgi:hypothetical protein